MTVRELIQQLEQVEDKDLPVSIGVELDNTGCYAVSEDFDLSKDHDSSGKISSLLISGAENGDSMNW